MEYKQIYIRKKTNKVTLIRVIIANPFSTQYITFKTWITRDSNREISDISPSLCQWIEIYNIVHGCYCATATKTVDPVVRGLRELKCIKNKMLVEGDPTTLNDYIPTMKVCLYFSKLLLILTLGHIIGRTPITSTNNKFWTGSRNWIELQRFEVTNIDEINGEGKWGPFFMTSWRNIMLQRVSSYLHDKGKRCKYSTLWIWASRVTVSTENEWTSYLHQ